MPGTLYLVSTPIGNLEDITHRAIRILSEVDLIACEDTRHTQKLLNHYGIKTKTISYHEHNERERAVELLEFLKRGSDVAVVSDAGTPGISDPGFRLARIAIDNQVPVVPVPGANALITALVASGMPTDEFFFAGFLPSRSAARRARLTELRSLPATLIFYEAPHRIAATLQDARDILGERQAVVARELTKMHEEMIRGRLSELAARYSTGDRARGEMVLIIDRSMIPVAGTTDGTGIERGDARDEDTGKAMPSIVALVTELEKTGLDHRAALKKAARQLGLSRAEAYRRLVAERDLERN